MDPTKNVSSSNMIFLGIVMEKMKGVCVALSFGLFLLLICSFYRIFLGFLTQNWIMIFEIWTKHGNHWHWISFAPLLDPLVGRSVGRTKWKLRRMGTGRNRPPYWHVDWWRNVLTLFDRRKSAVVSGSFYLFGGMNMFNKQRMVYRHQMVWIRTSNVSLVCIFISRSSRSAVHWRWLEGMKGSETTIHSMRNVEFLSHFLYLIFPIILLKGFS